MKIREIISKLFWLMLVMLLIFVRPNFITSIACITIGMIFFDD